MSAYSDRYPRQLFSFRLKPAEQLRLALKAARRRTLEVSRSVLREIGADAVPSRLVLSKMDRVGAAWRTDFIAKYADAMLLSARIAEDMAELRGTFTFLRSGDEVLPYVRQEPIGELYESARVLTETYDETGSVLTIRGLPRAIARLRCSVEAY